ncbi:hypothetical protein BDV32DRAFT_47661 [Aspergillus pseudonomiae]|uniref:Uncharacterized protein n=1 Tax=Aspergillus pseudonomiae TaxID=1506151 RepID=A0A5N6I162_9EURO|nr:uncharacterized protein BDV37DRAFT_77201 [Aspergillus pseudonomiae]KAB8260472.1 hypothetical protein BDV32DRAFT_47661 [Aspergillus pseudonomiae]KAE8409464.1 hypothetical protein BDV37DRAFT_77201 [Aspergillus pseudonomiae]
MAPRRLLLVSYPRTASNLLLKILALSDQPNVISNEQGGYFFMKPYTTASKDGRIYKPVDQWTTEECDEVRSAFQECLDNLEEYSSRAEKEGKMMVTKEHAFWLCNPTAFSRMIHGTNGSYDSLFHVQVPATYGASQTFSPNNETVFPDEYLRTWRLAFIIRHPALVFPSLYRAMMKMVAVGVLQKEELPGVLETNMSLKWTRMLYNYGMENNDSDSQPLLLDAHDVIHNPDVIARFCELAGLDSNKLKFEWEKKADANGAPNNGSPVEQRDSTGQDVRFHSQKAHAIMLSSLAGSSGVLKDKAPVTLDVATEALKWREEFGEDTSLLLEKAVLAAMPDYEFLKARRVQL